MLPRSAKSQNKLKKPFPMAIHRERCSDVFSSEEFEFIRTETNSIRIRLGRLKTVLRNIERDHLTSQMDNRVSNLRLSTAK